jgi:DNA-binding transcriptional regulator YdaS (Cro superfamily)
VEWIVCHKDRMPNRKKSISLVLCGMLALTNQTESWILIGMNANPIITAVQRAGSRACLARELGVSDTAIKKWELAWEGGNVRAVPAHRAVELEQATGLPRHLFRPDLWEAAEGGHERGRAGHTASAA